MQIYDMCDDWDVGLEQVDEKACRVDKDVDTPSGGWHTTTMISSVRLDGSTACMVVDGATTKDIFEAYIEQILLQSHPISP